MDTQQRIEAFLDGKPHAVVGASTNREKYGNKVLRCYVQNGRPVYPINPRAPAVENLKTFPDLASLPEPVHGISVITPPAVTEKIVEEAARAGIGHVWMQPGAESPAAIERAEALGLNVIGGDACILVALGFRDE
jgi:predicted CoA-binding protein